MKIQNFKIKLKSTKTLDFIDITELIQEKIKGFNNGIVNIQTLHTTTAIIINEAEPLLIEDMKKTLERLISEKNNYQHDNFEIRTVNVCDGECANGHAHCKALFLSPNITLNIVDNQLSLGMWQRIFFLELDRARDRQISIQIIGE
jgi:secondary thiamine-phosphate synthase enzyme